MSGHDPTELGAYPPREPWIRRLDEKGMEVVAEMPGAAYVLDARANHTTLYLRTAGRRKNRHRALAQFYDPGGRHLAILAVRALLAGAAPKKRRGRPRKKEAP